MDNTQERVMKVTLERTDGETESFIFHDDDGVIVLGVSKEPDFIINRGYCGSQEASVALLTELVEVAKKIEGATRTDKWHRINRN